MPTSKQARARQARQKERLAAAAVHRHEVQRRRRRLGASIGALVLVMAIVLAVVAGVSGGGGGDTTAAPPGVKPCVGLKDKLPAGTPNVPITAGPAPTKLVTRDLKVGTGAEVQAGAPKVTVNYVGVLCTTGTVLDNSFARKQTLDANLAGGVIPGWQQGIPGMKVGGRRLLEIPPDLAYGADGKAPDVPPNEPLFFVVDVVAV